MGFNKRYVDKSFILKNINDLDMLLKAGAIITTDSWSQKFLADLNPKEREVRKIISENTQLDADLFSAFRKYPPYNKLRSLSECLISLKIRPSWIDIGIAINKLNLQIDNADESGKFDVLKDKCIDAIILHYEK